MRLFPQRLKEAGYPTDERGRPDLRSYTDSLDYYIRMYEQHVGTLQGRTGKGSEPRLAFQRRVHATWGLIARGTVSVPFALHLLGRPEPVCREDGAAILAAIGKQDAVVDQLLQALSSERDTMARDSIILALGHLKNRKAVPALAAVIEDQSQDEDTRWTAVESLGRMARKRFLREADPFRAATQWLAKSERSTGGKSDPLDDGSV